MLGFLRKSRRNTTKVVSNLSPLVTFVIFLQFSLYSVAEVSFDERIALELDALDQLGEVESPVAERQAIAFQKPKQEVVAGEKDCDQRKAFDVRRTESVVTADYRRVLDCDEVRIMIKVLGPKVSCGISLL